MVRTTPDDDYDRKLLADIQNYGWHLVAIQEEEDQPDYVFSVGLYHTLGEPEICIFGLSDTRVMGQIINGIGKLMREGQRFEDWHASDEILEGYPCIFRSVGKSLYPQYLGYARWFYEGDDFPVLQCVWPDTHGYFPWQREFDSQFLPDQPILATVSSWPFSDAKNSVAFTTSKVIEDAYPILYASHDEDGDWQFLCGTTNATEDARIVCLKNLVELDPSITELADLPIGWSAEREDASNPWRRFKANG